MTTYAVKVERMRVTSKLCVESKGELNRRMRRQRIYAPIWQQGLSRLVAAQDLQEDRQLRGNERNVVNREAGLIQG